MSSPPSLIVKLNIPSSATPPSSTSAKQSTVESRGVKRKNEGEYPTFRKSMGRDMVDLYVGPNKEHFPVHMELLCSKIEYFEKMFKGEFAEAAARSATFPEDDIECFDMLLEWVYYGTIRPLIIIESPAGSGTFRFKWPHVKFYALAERLCVPELMDRIIDSFRAYLATSGFWPSIKTFKKGYAMTFKGSLLRKYLSTSYAMLLVSEEGDHWAIEKMSRALVEIDGLAEDVTRILRVTRGKPPNPNSLPACEFHAHSKDIPCPWKKAEDKE